MLVLQTQTVNKWKRAGWGEGTCLSYINIAGKSWLSDTHFTDDFVTARERTSPYQTDY